jgi:hypothetical protein
MLSSGVALLTGAGTVVTAYQAFGQEVSDRQVIVLCAAGGLVFSIFLQAVTGRFSKEEKPFGTKLFRVIVRDYLSHYLLGRILPFTVFYGYVKKSADAIGQKTFGLIRMDRAITVSSRDVTYLYPVFVGLSFGLLVGETIGKLIAHIAKS